MKKLLMILCLLAGITTGTLAQNTTVERTANEKSKELQQKLNLSKSQCDKVMMIYAESARRFETIRKEEHADNSRMAIKLAPVRRETIAKIKTVLTPAQTVKFDRLIRQSASAAEGWSSGWGAGS